MHVIRNFLDTHIRIFQEVLRIQDNEDVLAIRDIDFAFICCNKPYTMTVEQCARAVKAIRPAVFIPYHYGGTDTPTDLDALQNALKDVTQVLIRPLE